MKGNNVRSNLEGMYFGLWHVLFYYGTKKKAAYWFCECACGSLRIVRGARLKDGKSKSCGCKRKFDSVMQKVFYKIDKDGTDYNKEILLKHHKSHGCKDYLYFIDRGHPLSNNDGIVYYHRHVASLKVGRWIESKEQVHHKDGNTLNNELNNLEVMSKAEHMLVHKTFLKEKIRCGICGNLFKPHKIYSKYCSDACRRKGEYKVLPSKVELEELVWKMPQCNVAKLFKVCDHTIERWCKVLNISRPQKGHWLKTNTRVYK